MSVNSYRIKIWIFFCFFICFYYEFFRYSKFTPFKPCSYIWMSLRIYISEFILKAKGAFFSSFLAISPKVSSSSKLSTLNIKISARSANSISSGVLPTPEKTIFLDQCLPLILFSIPLLKLYLLRFQAVLKVKL